MAVAAAAPIYLFDPADKPSLPTLDVPVVKASDDSLEGYGCLVDDPDGFPVEIVPWPATGWRPIDPGTGDEAGCIEGMFRSAWQGDVLYGLNDAVGGHYVLGFRCDPQQARTDRATGPHNRILLWHLNYHPDGGQLFYPLNRQPFLVPLALPGDDLRPADVVAFRCDGDRGLYIHPGIWHGGVLPIADSQCFRDRQGRVHARVSCDLGAEFGVYLSVPVATA